MTSVPLHPTPSTGAIVLEQVRTVGLALRRVSTVFVALLCLLALVTTLQRIGIPILRGPQTGTIVTATGEVEVAEDGKITNSAAPAKTVGVIHLGYWPPGTFMTMLIGLFVPFGVWRSEDPARRAYHWTMPVAHGPHTLLKGLAGWLWLMAATAVYIGFAAAQRVALAPMLGGSAPSILPLPLSAWQWAIPFVAATVVYLFSSTAVIATEHPWRWIGTVIVVYGIGAGFLAATRWTELRHAWADVLIGSYGLYTVFCGIDANHLIFAMISMTGHLPRPSTADFLLWLKATALWTVVGGVGLLAASYRRPQ